MVARTVLVAGLLVALCRPSVAQTETPDEIARQLVAAVSATAWDRVASLMHPAALRQLRELLHPVLTMEGAEADELRQQVLGFAGRAAAIEASDSAVFVGLMRFTASQQEGFADWLQSAQYRVLGSVAEGPDTVHVVGRLSTTVQGATITQMEVVSLMRAGATWRGLLKGDFTALAAALRAALEQGP